MANLHRPKRREQATAEQELRRSRLQSSAAYAAQVVAAVQTAWPAHADQAVEMVVVVEVLTAASAEKVAAAAAAAVQAAVAAAVGPLQVDLHLMMLIRQCPHHKSG